MQRFESYDGTPIAYRVEGSGDPVVLIPGGPARPSGYFGDLAGLAADRQLIFFDLRGTGESGIPEDTSTYRVDRHADDVIALIDHLGLATVDLLGHSAGAGIAIFLAIGHSDRVRRLVLLTPSARVLGIPMVGFEEAWDARKDEPWYAEAVAADEALDALPDDADPAERDRLISLVMPFFYKRWDAVAQAHSASFPPVDAVLTGYYRDYVDGCAGDADAAGRGDDADAGRGGRRGRDAGAGDGGHDRERVPARRDRDGPRRSLPVAGRSGRAPGRDQRVSGLITSSAVVRP